MTIERVGTAWTSVKELVSRAREQQVTFVAAGLSYYAFLSGVPVVVFALTALQETGSEGVERQLVTSLGWSLPPSFGNLLTSSVPADGGRTRLTVTGLLVLGWSVFRFVRGIENAFDMVYELDAEKSRSRYVLDGVVVVAVIGLGIAAVMGATTVVEVLSLPFPGILGPAVLTLGLMVVFVPLYYVVPDADLGLRAVLPGGLLAGGTWAVLDVGFRTYLSYGGSGDVYGLFGGVVVSLTWVYLAALALLLGAVANAVVVKNPTSGSSTAEGSE